MQYSNVTVNVFQKTYIIEAEVSQVNRLTVDRLNVMLHTYAGRAHAVLKKGE